MSNQPLMTPRRLLVATHNRGKLVELAALLADLPIDLVTLDDVGIREAVPETGDTLAANAALKARGYARAAGLLTLADDSGLEVDALHGAPGVYTARYGDPAFSPVERYHYLLKRLADVPPGARWARFRCAMALSTTAGDVIATSEGVCEGEIARAARGDGGFGYDPVFYMPEHGRTMAELDAAVKNRVSHRARALQAIAPALRDALS